MTPEILAIIGVFISFGLGINAFFIKGLVDSIKGVQISLAEIVTKAMYSESEIRSLREKYHEHSNVIQNHSLSIQLMKSESQGMEKRIDTSENNQKDIFYRLHKLETKDRKI